MPTYVMGQEIAAVSYFVSQIKTAMHVGKGGVVIANNSAIFHGAVQAFKDTHLPWKLMHWVEMDYAAPFVFPMNVLQTPHAFLEAWKALDFIGTFAMEEVVSHFVHREENGTIFDWPSFTLGERMQRKNTSATLTDVIMDEVLALLTPLKLQLAQQENRVAMKSWVEDRHWVLFDVSMLDPNLQRFIAQYLGLCFAQEDNKNASFFTYIGEEVPILRCLPDAFCQTDETPALDDQSSLILLPHSPDSMVYQVSGRFSTPTWLKAEPIIPVSVSLRHQLQSKDGLSRAQALGKPRRMVNDLG